MTLIIVTLVLILLVALAARLWVALALMATGIIGLLAFRDLPVDKILAQSVWNLTTSPELLALPLFIFMSEILFRSRISTSIFDGLTPLSERLPGKLLHANVLGCTLFAAVSGSSAATALTVGRITLSELLSRGYDRGLAIGSLAGAGTLGFLIPPSLIMIIYGVLSGTSILKLFIAGIIPGLVLALAYMSFIAVRSIRDKKLVPRGRSDGLTGGRLLPVLKLLPILLLIFLVIGSMYGGYASPTEAAAIGVMGAMVLGKLQGRFTIQEMQRAALGAVRTTSMGGLIITGGVFFGIALEYLGVPKFITEGISALELGSMGLIFLLLGLYLALGLFLDGTSIIIMTLPITLPLVVAAGFDPVWFGVFLIMTVEMAQITPPVGFNLFVIQSLTGDPIGQIARHALPFFFITLLVTLALIAVPEMATYLPDTIRLRD